MLDTRTDKQMRFSKSQTRDCISQADFLKNSISTSDVSLSFQTGTERLLLNGQVLVKHDQSHLQPWDN